MKEDHLVHAATELAKELNRAVDEHLPQKLASIVKLHARLAVGSAFIPIPVADVAAAAANTWAMYVRINKELQLPFGDNIAKSLAAGVMTNVGSNVAGVMVIASAAKFLPGLGTVGGAALMAATIYALTIAAGIVYMKALTKLLHSKAAQDITEADLKSATDGIVRDKTAIKTIIDEAKRNYKDEPLPSADSADMGTTQPPSPEPFISDVVPLPLPDDEPSTRSTFPSTAVFVASAGKTRGPYPADEVRRMWASGELARDAQYWIDGMNGWRPLTHLPDVV